MRGACRHARRRHIALPAVLLAFAGAVPAAPAAASHDPNLTATLYVLGYDPAGAGRPGVYGDDRREPLADSIAVLAGLPSADGSPGPLPVNVVAGTQYYGDTPPGYYTDHDVAEVAQVTAQWGGGVPRYALIVAKHARRVLERSSAQQINLVSASFGTLITRWLIEHDVEGLASEGRIARWLSVEGLIAGNWAATQGDLVGLLDPIGPAAIDVDHMRYGWVEAHLHAPRTEAAHPAYAGILIGQVGSTDDRYNSAALRNAMLAYNQYQPNDGVQGFHDSRFHTVTPAARFAGRGPTLAVFHATHPGLASWRVAWAEAATFFTARRRITVTMTRAQVTNLREPQQPWWDWRPAEVVFESRVYSPAAEARWAVTQPLSAYVKEGTAAPLRRYRTQGETLQLDHVVFDDLVLPEETELRLDLHAFELDYDLRYGVVESLQAPYFDDLGGGTLVVSTLAPGTYDFIAADWNGQLSVSIFDYPFAQLVTAVDPGPSRSAPGLVISPNPSASSVRIVAPVAGATDEVATLEIADLTGRIVRRIEAPLAGGFVWDGRDRDGRALPAGVYLHRVTGREGVWRGRSCRVR